MISVIIPFYNEKDSLVILQNKLKKSLTLLKKEYEIIFVDDGSNDNGISRIKADGRLIKTVRLRKRLGKGNALKVGLENSTGDVVVFMDADLQDDPDDLKKFVKKIEDGYDFVNGIRIGRKDGRLVKIYSKLAAKFLRKFLNSPFTDINCGFKAFKREAIGSFTFYGNNFRFLPLDVFYNGFRVTEVEVKNNERTYGESKYGPTKLVAGIFDTLTAFFIYKFAEKPLHFFGYTGVTTFFIGFAILFYLTLERIFHRILLYRRPILFLGMLMVIVGIQIIMTGIIGELIVYFNKRK